MRTKRTVTILAIALRRLEYPNLCFIVNLMAMRLILIHGAPAVGKLTTAHALKSLTGIPLVDNHAAIDIARMALEFDAPGFWELIHDIRLTTFAGLARAGVPWLIATTVYSHPEDAPLVDDYDTAIGGQNGSCLDPIYLSCSKDRLIARVSSVDRVQRRKISSADGLNAYLADHAVAAIPHDRCLCLSTETADPTETAATIARLLHLPLVSERTALP
jgi:hypothetical protein